MTTPSVTLAVLFATAGVAQNSQAEADRTRTIIAPAAEAGGAPAKADKTRYCVVGAPTGTRIERRDCRTRAEWLDRGFDPLAKE